MLSQSWYNWKHNTGCDTIKVLRGFSRTETEHMPSNKLHHADCAVEQYTSSSAELNCGGGTVMKALRLAWTVGSLPMEEPASCR